MSGPGGTPAQAGPVGTGEVVTWLRAQLAGTLGCAPAALDDGVPLAVYGVSSLVSALLLADLEDAFGLVVDPVDVPPDATLAQFAAIAVAAPAP